MGVRASPAREPNWLRLLVGGACAYEAAAIAFGQLPTISRLCRRFPPLTAAIVGGLAWHLAQP